MNKHLKNQGINIEALRLKLLEHFSIKQPNPTIQITFQRTSQRKINLCGSLNYKLQN